ncbi:amidohydrolase [Priestia aryabhattai]|uniref:amidohydrolase n=1 Tax=Priestia megaterium TaxID=1404 RepID=UPI0039B912D4
MEANLVFWNGQVITVDQELSIVEAVAVKDNKILAVGNNAEIKAFVGDQTQIIDLKGKSLLPGFIDSHIHLTLYGTNKLGVSCKESHIHSINDVLADLGRKAKQTPKGEWVRAWGFNETVIDEKRFPSRHELDQISIEHPIMIIRTCAHISVVNSKALELAGINDTTPDPEGGKIVRDVRGKVTGVLMETAHMNMFEKAKYSDEELRKGMSLASKDFISAGITSIHDAGGYGPNNLRIMQEAVRSKDVKLRVYAIVGALNNSEDFVKKMTQAGIITGLGDEKFRIGPAKVFTDGSSSGPTIATRQSYTSDPNNYGILYFSQEELNHILGEAHRKGFQITAHAQGDRAIELMLNCIEEALRQHPRDDHRHRIEHAGITPPDLLKHMKKLGVIPIPNPSFFYEFGDGYIKNYGERVHHMFPVRSFIDEGVIAAGGSDSPVTTHNPLMGIHAGVNRESRSGHGVGTNQRISVMEAIKLYTWNGAYASFEEDIKGSIEIGKLADFVILSDSILDVSSKNIKDIQVDMTVIDGEIVYQQEKKEILS